MKTMVFGVLVVASNAEIVKDPPIFKVALAAWVKVPVPVNAVLTFNVLLLVNVTPVTVTLGMVNVLVSAWLLVLKVCTPLPAVKVPLLVIPPWKITGESPELFQVPPELMETSPVNVLVPVAEDITRLPVAPPPTVVVPVTVSVKPAAVKVVPSPIIKLPVIPKPTAVVVAAVPLNSKFPDIDVVPTCNVLVPLPLNVKLL